MEKFMENAKIGNLIRSFPRSAASELPLIAYPEGGRGSERVSVKRGGS